jgi:hypothetical protein
LFLSRLVLLLLPFPPLQLVSTIESMYSGENVVIVSPDSDNLSVLQAALENDDPDGTLPMHAQFGFANGDVSEVMFGLLIFYLLIFCPPRPIVRECDL